MRQYWVYIMASRGGVLYIGVTNDLLCRAQEHKSGAFLRGFTRQFNVHRLVYYETCTDLRMAISREKQLKSWRRQKKIELISSFNPSWNDLAPSPQVDATRRQAP